MDIRLPSLNGPVSDQCCPVRSARDDFLNIREPIPQQTRNVVASWDMTSLPMRAIESVQDGPAGVFEQNVAFRVAGKMV